MKVLLVFGGMLLMLAGGALATGPLVPGAVVTLRGTAADAKIGAILVTGSGEIGLDGLECWPEDMRGKTLTVTGTVTERADLPVFIPRPGEPIVSGIPMPEGTDLEKARKRLVLASASWQVEAAASPADDPLLEKIRMALPRGWTMKREPARLVFEREGEVSIRLQNRINAPGPMAGGNPAEGPARPGRTRVIFLAGPKLSDAERLERQQRNDALYEEIERLPEKLGMLHLINRNPNAKGGMFKTPKSDNDRRALEAYERERSAIEARLEKLPEYTTATIGLTFAAMEGVEDDMQTVDPPEASGEAFAVLNLIRAVLAQ